VTTALVHCYCYYRVAPAKAATGRKALVRVFGAIEQRLGIVGRLLAREHEPLLWMEVYENVRDADRFETLLAEQLESQCFSACLAPGSERRMERFVAAR
jgi:hypothetical protein